MSGKTLKKFRKTTKLYQQGKATAEEIQTVEKYYALFEESTGIEDKLNANDLETLKLDLYSRIQFIKSKNSRNYFSRTLWLSVAASLAIAIGLLLTARFGGFQVVKTQKETRMAEIQDYRPVGYTRNITLPDKSHIILKEGGEIVLGKGFNMGNTRELSLKGEAFFDVVHNPDRPFIIHTGKIKTTVLGTAFNINTNAGSRVEVSVVRGRVKVENGSRFLAVLLPNRQLSVIPDVLEKQPILKKVDAKKIICWASQDMAFEGMPFEKLAILIGERYGVTINFDHPGLKKCLVTGSFNGTESLKEILDILSQIRGTTYHISGTEVLISGKDCN